MDRLWEKYPSFLDSFLEDTDEYKNGFQTYRPRFVKWCWTVLKWIQSLWIQY